MDVFCPPYSMRMKFLEIFERWKQLYRLARSPRWISLEEAAELCGCSVKTLRRDIAAMKAEGYEWSCEKSSKDGRYYWQVRDD